MKNWIIFAEKGEYGVCCGECAESKGETEGREFITQCVVDSYFYGTNCELCGKNAGSYFAHYRKEAA